MFRIKDPKVSLEFYQNVIGMELLQEMKMSDFTNYFLAFPDDAYVDEFLACLSAVLV